MLASLLLASILTGATPPGGAGESDRGFALVELFTSEGCSSCPPADALLGRIAADAEREHRSVYALSFHVDYWDHLGWRDRFSDAAFTRRQGEYARAFGLASLYTPQMVVNGERQFVGSDDAKARGAIRDGLAQTGAQPMTVDARWVGRDVAVGYSVPHVPPDVVLEVAWVDDRATSSPSRGENEGRTLHHVDVVRELRSVTLAGHPGGTVTLHPPERSAGRVIAWVQTPRAGRVLGASASRRLEP
ncbi:MAG: DUF1223 domain-containing protein [Candidatus Eisenbacteria bacterium]